MQERRRERRAPRFAAYVRRHATAQDDTRGRLRVSRRRRALPAGAARPRRRRAAGRHPRGQPGRGHLVRERRGRWLRAHGIPRHHARRSERSRTSCAQDRSASRRTSCSRSTTATCSDRRCWHRARGALNMHGSLLPKYRGRAPVNWAVLHGERETGATLHDMTAKPDAGRSSSTRSRCRSCPTTRAIEVFRKVTVAAELVLRSCAAGAARRHGAAHAAGPRARAAISAAASPRTDASTGRRPAAAHPQPGARRRAALPRRLLHDDRRPAARSAHARALRAPRPCRVGPRGAAPDRRIGAVVECARRRHGCALVDFELDWRAGGRPCPAAVARPPTPVRRSQTSNSRSTTS